MQQKLEAVLAILMGLAPIIANKRMAKSSQDFNYRFMKKRLNLKFLQANFILTGIVIIILGFWFLLFR
jgi:hypothetical protein